jgi:hypothetical protein
MYENLTVQHYSVTFITRTETQISIIGRAYM